MIYEPKDFWDKVDIKSADECWEWKKGTYGKGYGQTKYITDKIHETGANRIAWILHHQKEIPKGLLICHTCDNRRCCNPSHLYAGTYGDNMLDREKRGRCNYTPHARGRFTEGEIWLIRKLKVLTNNDSSIIYSTQKKYKFTATLVAKMFKTSDTTILNIWNADKYRTREGISI